MRNASGHFGPASNIFPDLAIKMGPIMTKPQKPQWRNILNRRRKAYHAAHPTITAMILGHLSDLIHQRQVVAIYAALDGELDILPLCQMRPDVTFLLPRIEANDVGKHMQFLPWSEDLEDGPYGLKQPARGHEYAPNMVILPLLGMDHEGVRLGYGGGYYDRKLADLPHVRRVGVGFATQLVASLPEEQHDMRLDILVTDLGVTQLDRGAQL